MLDMIEHGGLKITEDNFLMIAMKSYANPHCMDIAEFHEDLKKIKYIKRLFNVYRTTGVLKERLILNHIIVFYNVFDTQVATKILFYKIPEEFWPILKTFLLYLHYLPDTISCVRDDVILTTHIPLDLNIVKKLREI